METATQRDLLAALPQDVVMPNLDGFEAALAIRALEAASDAHGGCPNSDSYSSEAPPPSVQRRLSAELSEISPQANVGAGFAAGGGHQAGDVGAAAPPPHSHLGDHVQHRRRALAATGAARPLLVSIQPNRCPAIPTHQRQPKVSVRRSRRRHVWLHAAVNRRNELRLTSGPGLGPGSELGYGHAVQHGWPVQPLSLMQGGITTPWTDPEPAASTAW